MHSKIDSYRSRVSSRPTCRKPRSSQASRCATRRTRSGRPSRWPTAWLRRARQRGHGVHDANDVLALPPTETADVGAGVRTTWLRSPRVDTENTHGTGCTLSSAIACGLARGLGLEESVATAKSYLMGALEAGLNLGAGSGPIDHMWTLPPAPEGVRLGTPPSK